MVQVDGQLLEEGVSELAEMCQLVKGSFGLDLTNLLSVDASGVEAIRKLMDQGVELVGISPYVGFLLRQGDRAKK